MKIQGKHFVITGGGSGLGAATAEYLVQQGASSYLGRHECRSRRATSKTVGAKS